MHRIDGWANWIDADPAVLRDALRAAFGLVPAEFLMRFERAGFDVLAFDEHARIQVDNGMRSRFAEPWRSMDQHVLEVTQGAIRARKKGLA